MSPVSAYRHGPIAVAIGRQRLQTNYGILSMEYGELTAVTFWQVMQRHLSERRRWYEEAYEWECLITRKKIKGYGCVDIEFAEGEVKSLQKLGDAHSHAFQLQWAQYEEFKRYVSEKLPSEYTNLPIAYCDDLFQMDPRKVALTIEQILHKRADCEELEIERKLAGKDSLLPIYRLLKATRKGFYVEYKAIKDELKTPEIKDKTVTTYLSRLEQELNIELDRPRGRKIVRLNC